MEYNRVRPDLQVMNLPISDTHQRQRYFSPPNDVIWYVSSHDRGYVCQWSPILHNVLSWNIFFLEHDIFVLSLNTVNFSLIIKNEANQNWHGRNNSYWKKK